LIIGQVKLQFVSASITCSNIIVGNKNDGRLLTRKLPFFVGLALYLTNETYHAVMPCISRHKFCKPWREQE